VRIAGHPDFSVSASASLQRTARQQICSRHRVAAEKKTGLVLPKKSNPAYRSFREEKTAFAN
jgi:hypothetical protein